MRITEKGQVTIPITLRRRYGLQRNVEVEFVAEKDGVRIKKRGAGAANPFHALRGKGKSAWTWIAISSPSAGDDHRLLARDRGFYRRYFSGLEILPA